MKIENDCIWLCSDCTQVACNGTHGIELENKQATVTGLAKLGPYVVPNFDSDTGDGIREFSSRICEACGTSLAGYRAKFATLVPEWQPTDREISDINIRQLQNGKGVNDGSY